MWQLLKISIISQQIVILFINIIVMKKLVLIFLILFISCNSILAQSDTIFLNKAMEYIRNSDFVKKSNGNYV
ncbi:hypothetical protein BH10BAC5_BH10BAC5_27300 [soil metagenome]